VALWYTETFTYVKVCSSVAHPPNHNIRIHHSTVGRDTETHPARRADVHREGDRTLRGVEVPVEHVRTSIPVVECQIEWIPEGVDMSTQNDGQQSQ